MFMIMHMIIAHRATLPRFTTMSNHRWHGEGYKMVGRQFESTERHDMPRERVCMASARLSVMSAEKNLKMVGRHAGSACILP